MEKRFLIYGATGYTGKLIAEMAKKQGFSPLLGGRNPQKLKQLSETLDLEYRAVALDNKPALLDVVSAMDCVLHIAGPFSGTAAPMVEACLETQTHYLDITGEIAVFERHSSLDETAKSAGIMMMSGVGFDVVPTDCMAAYVKKRLPDADQLMLSVFGTGKVSPGTAKTAVESIKNGTQIRRDGRIVQSATPLYREIDFGQGPFKTIAASWGDVATAFYTTGIPNITVYFQTNPQLEKMVRMGKLTRWILGLPVVQKRLKAEIERKVKGPDEKQRESFSVTIIAEAVNPDGDKVVSKLTTPEGYTLTGMTALEIVKRLLDGELETGYRTPAMVYGADFITEFNGIDRKDIPSSLEINSNLID
jgi:short subunit dehydrogenase-like uncharacterized protein